MRLRAHPPTTNTTSHPPTPSTECAITGSVGIDDNKIASIIDASPVTWDASECLLVFNDENDTDDYTVVCNLTGDDLRDWKDLLSENEKVMFTSGLAIPKMN